jgi:hypothetical protein
MERPVAATKENIERPTSNTEWKIAPIALE